MFLCVIFSMYDEMKVTFEMVSIHNLRDVNFCGYLTLYESNEHKSSN